MKKPESPLIVFYDEGCGICSKIARFLSKLASGEMVVVYKKAADMDQFTKETSALQNRYQDMYSLSDDKIFNGYDTYLQIALRTQILLLVSIFMQFLFVRNIGEKIYRRIANSRSCQPQR